MAELTGKEIVAIIKAGKESNAVQITVGNFTVQFQSSEQENSADLLGAKFTQHAHYTDEERNPPPDYDDNVLGLVDPAAYEERIINGDLANEENS